MLDCPCGIFILNEWIIGPHPAPISLVHTLSCPSDRMMGGHKRLEMINSRDCMLAPPTCQSLREEGGGGSKMYLSWFLTSWGGHLSLISAPPQWFPKPPRDHRGSMSLATCHSYHYTLVACYYGPTIVVFYSPLDTSVETRIHIIVNVIIRKICKFAKIWIFSVFQKMPNFKILSSGSH